VINERQYIKDAIYDWVAAVVVEEGRTDPVIWDNEDGPRPEPPFISLEFTGTSTPGFPDYSMVETDPDNPGDQGVQEISRFVRRALTMYGFGKGALDLLETIKASYEKEAYIQMLAEKGLVIPYALEVRENPTVRGTDTETSALFEFYVTYTRVIEDSPGWIETVRINPSEDLPMEEITNEEELPNG
jgi:hypothetical protein